MSVARSTLRYESRLVKRDAPVVGVMRELAAQYPRYGYRRIQVFLERHGHAMSADRALRLWRLHGLQVPRKRPRRKIATGRPRPFACAGPWRTRFRDDDGQHSAGMTDTDPLR
jgi:putative transposase